MEDAMLIDCDTCSAQGVHCHDCVITVLVNAPPLRLELDSDDQIAFVSLAAAGLVPPLRLAHDGSPDRTESHRDARGIA
jgi:hypothetical protein